jgi:hypothetical protein
MSILNAVIGEAIDTAADRLIPDLHANKKFKLEMKKTIVEASVAGAMAQAEINKIEAEHPSVFVAGWRPFLGWVCCGAFGYNFVVYPFLVYLSAAFLPDMTSPPMVELGPLMVILTGMLGLTGMRTMEGLEDKKRSTFKWRRSKKKDAL